MDESTRLNSIDPNQNTVAGLMEALRRGEPLATRRLFDLFYPELRRLAGQRMRGEKKHHSWQPTVLVNELYLEFLKIKSLKGGANAQDEKEQFLRLAAFLMRRLLIHHARPLRQRVEQVEIGDDFGLEIPEHESLVDIDKALAELADIDPKLRILVEMRVFEGRTMEEIAHELECSTKTATRYWNFAQHWLQERLGDRA